MTRDPALARDVWRRLEPVHAVTYFAPQAKAALEAVGYRGFWRGYFAGRAAALGSVGAAPVVAMFYGFAPAMVARALPSVWRIAPPEVALDAAGPSAPAKVALALDAAAGRLRQRAGAFA